MKYKSGYLHSIKTHGVKNVLRENGVKATRPREEILCIFSENRFPMTAEMIASKLKNGKKADMATVYRTIEIFENKLIIKKVNLSGNSKYYEISDSHHHHIICSFCGIIEELEDCSIEKKVPHSDKFMTIFDHSLEYFGRCKKCIKE